MSGPDAVTTEIVRGFRELSVPTVVDCLDYEVGLRGWLSSSIRPLVPGRIAGRAVTVRISPAPAPTPSLDPIFAAVDACGPDTILVLTNGGDFELSCMGDLVATALHARGAEGAVMDGGVRDTEQIRALPLPVFAASTSPVNWVDKAVVDWNLPILCGGTPVRPGDVVLADHDGVVVVPVEHAAAVLAASRVLEAREAETRERLRTEVRTRPTGEVFRELEDYNAAVRSARGSSGAGSERGR